MLVLFFGIKEILLPKIDYKQADPKIQTPKRQQQPRGQQKLTTNQDLLHYIASFLSSLTRTRTSSMISLLCKASLWLS